MPAPTFKLAAYVDAETWHKVDEIASRTDRTHSYLLKLAIRRLLECDACPVKNLRPNTPDAPS